jgi:hypothetical protein
VASVLRALEPDAFGLSDDAVSDDELEVLRAELARLRAKPAANAQCPACQGPPRYAPPSLRLHRVRAHATAKQRRAASR